VAKSLKGPRIGFLVAAWINLASAVAGLLQSSEWKPIVEVQDKISWLPNINLTYFSIPEVSFASLITLAFAIWMFVLANKLRRQTDYYFVFVSAILLLMLAAHPTYALALIFSIWTLVALSDPQTKAAFRSESRIVAQSSFGVGSSAQAGVENFLRTFLLFFLVLASVLLSVFLLYFVFMFAAPENPKQLEKDVTTVEASANVNADETSATVTVEERQTDQDDQSVGQHPTDEAEDESREDVPDQEDSASSTSSALKVHDN
jgi:hypothetical protein